MKIRILLVLLMAGTLSSIAQKSKREISGRIAKEDGPLKNVNVRVKNTSAGVLTNAKGRYAIDAFVGDTLVFSYVGFHTIQVPIDNENNVYNLDMYPEVQELDEVVVKKEKRPFSQKELLAEYPTNMKLIKSSWGILDKERSSFSFRIIDGKDLINIGSDILYSLENLHPQMRVTRDCLAELICPKVFLQQGMSGATSSAIFDVDGFIYQQVPTFLAAQDIDRVAILTRNGAFTRYGPAGSGGVIIINTKSKTVMDEAGVERTYDNSDLTDSINDIISETKAYARGIPDYMKRLSKSSSQKEALKLFENQKKKFAELPYYFFDASEYFNEKWKNKTKSAQILNDVRENFSKEPEVLRALAYRYEQQEAYEKALELYLQILKLRSKDAQSYRDVANAYGKNKNFRTALMYYARYELAINQIDSLVFDKYGIDLLLTTESANIFRRNPKEFPVQDVSENDLDFPPSRLLFEWNDNNADFKLRIVSPDDYYDDWVTPGKESIEKLRGYSSKQFFLDDSFKGEWQTIVNYFGDLTNPVYLKVTTFFDYGTPSQSEHMKVFKLSEKDVNIKLFSIDTREKSTTY